jgi:alkaline phosphatase D
MSFSRRGFAQALSAAAFAASSSRRLEAQDSSLFRHGVASGDPLVDRVIIWTRLTPAAEEDLVPVEWLIAADPQLNRVLQRGITYTNSQFDYTVKVDVTRLDPGTTYYYRFTSRGASSPVGRVDRLRFAVTSCSNFPYGFFNSYRAIANRRDLDAVLHLGDYIYEYAEGQYGNGTALGRAPLPNREIVSLQDYRTRYAQYRSDADLQEIHRQNPFIVVWDDHESTNDAWQAGAQNHQPDNEGDWSTRRALAIQAWNEWMPVREQPFLGEIYRTFRFGDLIDLIMLDTRLAGRNQQAPNGASPLNLDPSRTLLGLEQEDWFYRQLNVSRIRGTRWRVVGQQVMMGQLLNPADGSFFNSDQWDGYTASRNRLLQFLGANQIENVVVLTGDIHSSWGNEIAANPFSAATATPQAVEFVTPAVTSPGIDDRAQANLLQAQIGATHPHVKFVELFRRGYLLVDVTRDRAQAEWYHVRTITERTADEELGRVLQANSGTPRLVPGTASQPAPAPPPFAA